MLTVLLISSGLMTSCATSKVETFIIGVDGDDLAKGCPSDLKGKMWITNSYAKQHYHLENHK